jgi:hypothetical protein
VTQFKKVRRSRMRPEKAALARAAFLMPGAVWQVSAHRPRMALVKSSVFPRDDRLVKRRRLGVGRGTAAARAYFAEGLITGWRSRPAKMRNTIVTARLRRILTPPIDLKILAEHIGLNVNAPIARGGPFGR